MESSGACNLKGAVSREAAIAAPIIKLLWSPARESKAQRGGGRERRKEKDELENAGTGCMAFLVLKVVYARKLLKHPNARAKVKYQHRLIRNVRIEQPVSSHTSPHSSEYTVPGVSLCLVVVVNSD